MGQKGSLFGVGLDDPAASVDGGVPKFVNRIPSEVVVRDRVREASVCVLLVLEDVTYDLAIEGPVREMGPGRERVIGDVCGSRLSQRPLEAVNELRHVREAIVRDDGPFLPACAVLANLEGVDADLGLEGGLSVGERVVERMVVVQGRDTQRRSGLR